MLKKLIRHGLVSVSAASLGALAFHGVSSAGIPVPFTLTPGTVEFTAGSVQSTVVTIAWDPAVPTEPGEYDAWAAIDEYAEGCDPLPEGVSFSWLPVTQGTFLTYDSLPAYYWGGSSVPDTSNPYNSAPTGILLTSSADLVESYTFCFGTTNSGSFEFPPVTISGAHVPLTVDVSEGLPETGGMSTGTILFGVFCAVLGAVASVTVSRRRHMFG